MFFILSKVLSFLLLPVLYIFVLLLIAVLSKKTRLKRRCLIWGIALFWIFSAPLFLNLLARAWDIAPAKLQQGKTYSAAIILGGFTSEDKRGRGVFNWAADRFIQGVLLQRNGKAKKIVISGGNSKLVPGAFREADFVLQQLRVLQIPDSCILIENRARNTLENASLTKALLLKNKQQGPYLLVTSAFHMRRAIQIFKSQDVDVIPYSCNVIAGDVQWSFFEFMPNAEILNRWSLYIKEIIGFTVNWVLGKG
jgi:uncharacterized SAM-binding protein YcdF (DUF218 family)